MEVRKGYRQTEVGVIPDNWELRQLRDILNLKSGFAFSSEYFSDSGPIVITPGNFKLDGGLIFNKKNSNRYSGNYSPSMKFNKGDLLIVMTDLTPDCNLLGKPGFIETDEIILHNQRIGKIILKNRSVTLSYLYWFFVSEAFSKRMKDTATGSTVRHTSNGSIYNTFISFPAIEEQTAIATALSDTDALITSLEKLIAKKRYIKQGAMQELLKPKKGWEVKRLGDLTKTFTKQTGFDYTAYIKPSLTRKKTGETIPFIQNKDFNNKFINMDTDYFIPTRVAKMFPQILLNEKSLLISISGSIGNIGVYDSDQLAFIGGAVAILKFNNPDLIDWVMYYLKSDDGQDKLFKNVKAGSHQNLILDDIRKVEICFPSQQEQILRTRILSDMDYEIMEIESKLEKYKQIKSGMMQNLLTGKIRLV